MTHTLSNLLLSISVLACIAPAAATPSPLDRQPAASQSALASTAAPPTTTSPVEHWIGQILIPNPSCAQITFVISLTQTGHSWSGRFSMSPGCGVSGSFDITAEEVARTNDLIRFVTPPPPGRNIYELIPAPDGQTAAGRLIIGGVQPVYIRATRATDAEARNAAPARPQTPSLPLPYEQRTVTATTTGPSGTLAGILTLPRRDAAAPLCPAVVLLPDEDPVDLDHTEGMHKPGQVLADLLSRRGIAVLRCASPGMEGSGGSYLDSTMADAAADATGLVAYLKTIEGIDPARVGIIGRGEGAYVAARAAAEHPDTPFTVLMAPAAISWRDLLLVRERRQLEAQGEDRAYITARLERFGKILSHAASAQDDALAAALEQDFDVQMKQGRAMGMLNIFQQRDMIQVQADFYRTPRLISRLNEDPRPHLAKIRAPVLLLATEMDLLTPTNDTLPAVQETLKAAGNTRVSTRTFPRTNHWFQPCSTGFPDERAQIDITMSPEVADAIAEWIASFKP